MQLTIRLLLVLFWGGFLTACRQDVPGQPLRAYYFPLEKLRDGLVYEYRKVPFAKAEDSLATFYTYYRTVVEGGRTYLLGMQFDYALQPQSYSREELVANGMSIVGNRVFRADSTGTPVEQLVAVEAGAVFPFGVQDSAGVFLYVIKMADPQDTTKFTRLIRNRRWAGNTVFQFQGKSLPAVRFSLAEAIEDYADGYFDTEYSGEEIYARGIGLVYLKKMLPGNLTLEYQLHDTYPKTILEQNFKRNLEIH
jgi:hypothetical protein